MENSNLVAPYARYGHTGCYVELENAEEVNNDGTSFKRKYLYVYGGFSFKCATACFDLWRYEIPYTPIIMPPVGRTINLGNHWELLQEDATYGPGKRWKV